MRKKLSVIICTYNRANILKDCIEAICIQTVDRSQYDVIVVDNNSIDSTAGTVYEYQKKYENISYIKEINQGLSFARNRGAIEANNEWLAFLDDDGLAHKNFVEECLNVINFEIFDCFGGIYFPWYKYGKPKWLSSTFGAKQSLCDQISEIYYPHLDGGIFAIKKNVLEKIGGFPTHLGMIGNQIAYGEETLLQVKLLDNGYKLGFSPFWKMDHLVAKYKLNIKWHLSAEFAKGRDCMKIENRLPVTWSKYDKVKFILYIIITRTFPAIIKLFGKDYYFQNALFDIMQPIYYRFGQQSILSKRK